MGNGVLVSIIIPVFNTEKYLIEALDSVIHQTYEKLEIIIIDDGSIDDSGKICDDYARKDKRIVVVHQENKGLSAARNIGLDMMTGDVVVFLDSDDALCPDYVKIMIEAMIREKSDLIICRYTTHSTTEKMTRSGMEIVYPSIKKGLHDREGALQALVEKRINNHVWNKLYISSLWENIRFPSGHVFEDIDTMYRIIDKSAGVYVVDDVLCFKRIHPGSISATYTKQNINDWVLAYNHFGLFIKQNTPNIFSEGQLIQFQQTLKQYLIEYYLLYSQKRGNHDKVFLEDMRKRIVENDPGGGIGEYDFRKKLLYQMICHCPWLLRIVYPIYLSMRHAVKGCVSQGKKYLHRIRSKANALRKAGKATH